MMFLCLHFENKERIIRKNDVKAEEDAVAWVAD